jgi:hypothetical protein
MTSIEIDRKSGEPVRCTEERVYWKCLIEQHRHQSEEACRTCIALVDGAARRRAQEAVSQAEKRDRELIQREGRWEAMLWYRERGDTLAKLGARFGMSKQHAAIVLAQARRWKRGCGQPAQLLRSLLPLHEELRELAGQAKDSR